MGRGSGTLQRRRAIEASMNKTIALLEADLRRTLDVAREPAVPGDQRRTNADTTRITRARLGARVSLEDGLRSQWEWARLKSARDE